MKNRPRLTSSWARRAPRDDVAAVCLAPGLGQNTLTGIVSAEAIALWEETITSMTKAKLVLTAFTIVTGALLFAGVGLVGFAASRQDNPLRAGQAGKEPNPPDTGPERKQGAAASAQPQRTRKRIKAVSSSRPRSAIRMGDGYLEPMCS